VCVGLRECWRVKVQVCGMNLCKTWMCVGGADGKMVGAYLIYPFHHIPFVLPVCLLSCEMCQDV